ncbi:DUF4344 domain-containing metallopeptidase [Shewanella waksmanii]|uniref:DUF4344 domain-containing metallopeptidase n=1 Tax=Shewanella waksmanii TaxID=213783 RepID=UPI003734D1CC
MNEHSFDLQRYFSILCLTYGSQPQTHQRLLKEIETTYRQDRQEFCVDNYHLLNDSWQRYLSQPRG